ncbi:hypothetical protein [Tumebacillus flagellatus]|uniref:Uncharacterized protein n=1 Tax=Tumebacillus flagellatus TaxID=1157490 RepID=A0A074LWB8_9BACL|nr:hypothetical protein [Tumebacillus flagellatus]KEO84890.1 hypothetical protein EL26_02445 [Tumebacillus flagellatus]
MANQYSKEFLDRYEELVDSIEVLAASVLRGNRFTPAEAVAFTLNELGDDDLHDEPHLALVGYVHLLGLLDESKESRKLHSQLVQALYEYFDQGDVTVEHIQESVVSILLSVGETDAADKFLFLYNKTLGGMSFLDQLMMA